MHCMLVLYVCTDQGPTSTKPRTEILSPFMHGTYLVWYVAVFVTCLFFLSLSLFFVDFFWGGGWYYNVSLETWQAYTYNGIFGPPPFRWIDCLVLQTNTWGQWTLKSFWLMQKKNHDSYRTKMELFGKDCWAVTSSTRLNLNNVWHHLGRWFESLLQDEHTRELETLMIIYD